MRTFGPGDTGPAVEEIRAILRELGLLAGDGAAATDPSGDGAAPTDRFDDATVRAVRAFQQARGLTAHGRVTEETWRALEAARWHLGARTLHQSVDDPVVGDDVQALQERLLELGYDPGRPDGIYGPRTAAAVARFQRETGLRPDGSCGPETLGALRRLGRKVVGGRPQWLREAERFRARGPRLVGQRVVIDPGHGGPDPGVAVHDRGLRWTEAELVWDLAARVEGRLAAAGVRVHLTRGPRPDLQVTARDRAALANELAADLLISLHIDGHPNEEAAGVAAFHYGAAHGPTSTVGERLAGLVQREIVARTGMRDCRTHGRTWDLLRLTRMPAVRVEIGYLTAPSDRARLIDPRFRDTVADAVVAATQRMYYPLEADVATGSLDVSELRRALTASP